MKLGKVANIKVGLPLIRKKGNIHNSLFYKYNVVTLKSFSSIGVLLKNELDEFISTEKLNQNYLTSEGDILVRLRNPNIAVYVDKDSAGLLVPSLVAIVRPSNMVNSQYLVNFLNSNFAQKLLQKELQGTTISMIKLSELSDLEVIVPNIKIQNDIVNIIDCANKEIDLIENLQKLKIQLKHQLLDNILKQEIIK